MQWCIPVMIKSNISTVIFMASTICSSAVCGDVIYEDNFESGAFNPFWTDRAYVYMSSSNTQSTKEQSRYGQFAAQFLFKGGASGEDAMSELRFDLGQIYPELTISFDLYIPDNYVHRDDVSTDNNKFFRLWPNEYNDKEKVGASLMYEPTGSKMAIDLVLREDWGLSLAGGGTAGRFITNSDLGKWMHVDLSVYSGDGDDYAYLSIYKNGDKFIEYSQALDYDPTVRGYRYGYLLGWANSGFEEDTRLMIDNVVFKDNAIDKNAKISKTVTSVHSK